MKKFTKYVAVALAGLVVAGCASIPQELADNAAGKVAYMRVSRVDAVDSILSKSEMQQYCRIEPATCGAMQNPDQFVLVTGFPANSMSLQSRNAGIVKKYDAPKPGDFVKTRLSNITVNAGFYVTNIEKASNDGCRWVDSGVVCTNWDYRKDYAIKSFGLTNSAQGQ